MIRKYLAISQVFLVNVILVLVGILFLEVIFGNWLSPNNLNRLNLIKSRTIKWNIKGLYDYPDSCVTYTRDRYGLRGNFEDPSEIDILTVGGSTTDQRYINDGETWQDIMQQKFAVAHKNIVVANAGVDGQSTFGHLKNFDWWFPSIPALKPKFIIYYIGINDFYRDDGDIFDKVLADNQPNTFMRHVREKSAIYHLLRMIRGIFRAMMIYKIGHNKINFEQIEWTNQPLQHDYETLMKSYLEAYAERLKVLIAKTKEFGAIPIFVTQPARQYRISNGAVQGIAGRQHYEQVFINGVDYYHMIRKLDAVTLALCEENGAIGIDLAKETEDIWNDDDFYDFCHMTPKGLKKVGLYLYQELSDKLSNLTF